MSTNDSTKYPVETKVKAATAAAGGAAIVAAFLVWIIDSVWYNGDGPPDVPYPVVGLVGFVVSVAGTFVAGYYAKHSPRP